MPNNTLGRGLESLIPKREEIKSEERNILSSRPKIEELADKIMQIPVEKIAPNPQQPRQNVSDDLADLAASIKEHGIIQPLIVSPTIDGYQLIAGERRLRAAETIGLKTVPAIVREIEKHQQLELALIENIQRKDLNAIEQAAAFRRLIEEFNFTHEELARRVGKSRPYISNLLRLLNLPEEIKKAIVEGKILFTTARTLAGLPPEQQLAAFQQLKDGQIETDGLEFVRRQVKVERHFRRVGKDPNVLAKQQELEAALGTRVVIKKSGSSGQIIIDFYSEEDLANLIQKLISNG